MDYLIDLFVKHHRPGVENGEDKAEIQNDEDEIPAINMENN